MEQRVTCPSCGAVSVMRVVRSVDARDASAKEALLSGRMFSHRCPACRRSVIVHYSCVYVDADRRFAAMLLGEGAPADIAAQAGLPRDYTLRVVRRADALIEKALLASDALDDRVLEVCKLMARDTYNKTHAASPVGALYYAGSASGGQLLFYGQAASGEALHLSVQRDTYDAAAQNLRAALKAPAPLEVNAQWARQVLGTALFTKQED